MSPERPLSDRRTYLKYAGATAVTALAGCSGGDGNGNGGPGHEVPHPDDATVPESEMNAQSLGGTARPDEPTQAKDAVDYEHVPNDGEYCGNCTLFVPDQDGDGFGACVSVKGKVHHCDYCTLYAPYDGDDAVPCEN